MAHGSKETNISMNILLQLYHFLIQASSDHYFKLKRDTVLQEIKFDFCQKNTDSNHFARPSFGNWCQRRDIRGTNNSEEPFDFELIRVDRFFQSYRIPRRANLLQDFSPDEQI